MTTKEVLLESAEKALTQEEFVSFHILIENEDLFSIKIMAEENLEKSKEALFENVKKDYCDPAITSNFKLADEFFNKAFDYAIGNIEVKE